MLHFDLKTLKLEDSL
ncbi:hypothetical protein BDFB_011006 [Asbolus verrucosus]|uniref:Uncharacterized protein n=1 Tax=Asbolus verrucosus TaxID=1661398 RepID=A0A482VY47_ASBVE|nr:hypothetical protein BDFB_011006 [Asbolus verrucosus]